jgi:hypothetical protein
MNAKTDFPELVELVPVDRQGGELPMKVPPVDDEVAEALVAMGHTKMTLTRLKSLSTIGLYSQSLGMVVTQRGQVLVSQQWVNNAQRDLSEMLERVKGAPEKGKHSIPLERKATMIRLMAKDLGYLGKVQSEAAIRAISMGGALPRHLRAEPEDLPPIDPNYKVGTVIRPAGTMISAREVHIHAPERTPEKPLAPPPAEG